jgi:hypothetical protein
MYNSALQRKDLVVLSEQSKQVAIESQKLYDTQLRENLERSDRGKFVCIEPKSGDYFIGETFDDAVNQAIDAHPDCRTHTLRVGYSAALHLGVFTCYLEWFGNEYRTQIIANDGAHPLLGTMLLDGHDLTVSYKRKTVELA